MAKKNKEVTPEEVNMWKWQDRANQAHEQKIKERLQNGGVKLFPTKLSINLTCNRGVSKFLSKKIPAEFGAADYFRHRWLKGFKADFKLSHYQPASNTDYVDVREIIVPKAAETPLYDY